MVDGIGNRERNSLLAMCLSVLWDRLWVQLVMKDAVDAWLNNERWPDIDVLPQACLSQEQRNRR